MAHKPTHRKVRDVWGTRRRNLYAFTLITSGVVSSTRQLIGPYLKVKRAKEHLDLLNRRILAFKESKCYTLSRKKDLEAGEYIVTFTMVDPPIDPLALIAGDFIVNLRASLDHLAFRLAMRNGTLPEDNVSFPICDGPTPTSETRKFITRATKGMPKGAIDLIESFQPYHHRDSYKLSYLWRLNHLWNVDKHRHLMFHSGFVHVDFPEIPKDAPIRKEELDNGGRVIVPLAFVRKNVKFKPKPWVEIQFGDERQGLMLTIKDFFEIYEFVSDKLIPKFARFLK